jgi:hypothetical protein
MDTIMGLLMLFLGFFHGYLAYSYGKSYRLAREERERIVLFRIALSFATFSIAYAMLSEIQHRNYIVSGSAAMIALSFLFKRNTEEKNPNVFIDIIGDLFLLIILILSLIMTVFFLRHGT